MADEAQKRNELLDERNDIAACMADPTSEDAVAFFATRASIARLKAEAKRKHSRTQLPKRYLWRVHKRWC